MKNVHYQRKYRTKVLVELFGVLKNYSIADLEDLHRVIYGGNSEYDFLELSKEPNIVFIFTHNGFEMEKRRTIIKEKEGLHIVQNKGQAAEHGYYVNYNTGQKKQKQSLSETENL